MLDKKTKFGIQDYLKLIHQGKTSFIFDDLINNIDDRRRSHLSLQFEEDQEALDSAMKTAEIWYRSLLPENTLFCPKDIEETKAYQYANIDDILENAEELSINPNKEPYLLWIPRILCSIDLPPFWRVKPLGDYIFYYNIEHDIISQKHPGIDFFKEYTSNIKDFLIKEEKTISRI